MAKRRKKTSKKTGKKRARKSKARRKTNTIPLPILEHRLSRLSRIVRSRGGKAA
jgi:hypothetical protein